MKLFGTVLLILFSNIVFAQSGDNAHAFDFWVGEWELSWEYADGSKGSGTNLIEKRLMT